MNKKIKEQKIRIVREIIPKVTISIIKKCCYCGNAHTDEEDCIL